MENKCFIYPPVSLFSHRQVASSFCPGGLYGHPHMGSQPVRFLLQRSAYYNYQTHDSRTLTRTRTWQGHPHWGGNISCPCFIDSSKCPFCDSSEKSGPLSPNSSVLCNNPTDLFLIANLKLVQPSGRVNAHSGFHTKSEGGKLEESGEEPGINWEVNFRGKFIVLAGNGKSRVGLNHGVEPNEGLSF